MMEALPLFDVRQHQRAAVLLISDGSDTGSHSNVRDVRRLLRRSDAFVYAIAIDAPDTRPINDRVNPFALREMTSESGGYTEVVHDSPELGPATARIAEELNHQVHAQLHILASGRWELSLDPPPCRRERISRAHSPRVCRGAEPSSLGAPQRRSPHEWIAAAC